MHVFRSKEHEWNEYSTLKTSSILITIKCQQISTEENINKSVRVSESLTVLISESKLCNYWQSIAYHHLSPHTYLEFHQVWYVQPKVRSQIFCMRYFLIEQSLNSGKWNILSRVIWYGPICHYGYHLRFLYQSYRGSTLAPVRRDTKEGMSTKSKICSFWMPLSSSAK